MQKTKHLSLEKILSSILFFVFFLSIDLNCNNKTSTSELLAGNFSGPPEITWLYPKQNGDGFPVNDGILFSTTLPIDLAQIQTKGVLKDEFGTILPVSVKSTGTYGFEVDPQVPLTINRRYTYTIPAGTQATGSKFIADKVLSFSTLAVLQPVASSFGTATNGTSTYVFPEGTTTNNASITFSKSVTGVALSPTSLHIETDTGCMNCATISALGGSGAGPYTFTINGLNSGVVYFLKIGGDIKDAEGNSAASRIQFAVAPVVSNVKNLGSRGVIPLQPWFEYFHEVDPPVIAIDPGGNRYVAGTFFGSADWGGGIRHSDQVYGNISLFVVKYDPAGNYLWDKVWDIGLSILPVAIKADSTGVYILGDYVSYNTYTLDTANGVSLPPTNISGLYYLESFLIKADSTGTAVWATKFAAANQITSNMMNGANAMEFTPTGNLAVVAAGFGTVMASMTITGTGAGTACTLGAAGQYVLVLNPINGGCVTHSLIENTLLIDWAYNSGYWVTSIGFDANYIYLTGTFYGGTLPMLFSVPGSVSGTTFNGGTDIFVARIGYTDSGGFDYTATPGNSWVKVFGGTGFDSGLSLAVDSANNKLYVAGSIQGPIDFGCSGGCAAGSSGTQDGFLLALDTTTNPGTPVWAQTIGGTTGDDQSQKVLVYNSRVRVFTRYDMNIANFKTNQFGCAFNNFNGFGLLDLVMTIYDANGNFDGAHAFGSVGDELLFPNNYYYGDYNNHQGSYVAQDSAGKMTALLYMGSGTINSVPIFPSSNPQDIVMWDMQ